MKIAAEKPITETFSAASSSSCRSGCLEEPGPGSTYMPKLRVYLPGPSASGGQALGDGLRALTWTHSMRPTGRSQLCSTCQ